MRRRSSWSHFVARPSIGRWPLAALLLVALVGLAATPASALTFRIDSPREELDAKPGDGICATASGACTLRAALEEADASKRAVEIVRPALADPSVLLPVRSATRRAIPRSVPTTTFVVDTTADTGDAAPGDGTCATADGACSLRAAIMEANDLEGPQAITLPAGEYILTLAGADDDTAATGDLDVLESLELTGVGAALTTVDGNDVDRVFDDMSSSFTMTGVRIANGNPEAINGMLSQTTLNDCEISDSATGLRMYGLGLTITGGRFAENGTAATLSYCSVTIDGVMVEKNQDGFDFHLGNTGTIRNGAFRFNRGAGAFLGIQNELAFDQVELSDNGAGLDIGFSDFGNSATIENSVIERNSSVGISFREGSVAIATSAIRDNGGCALSAGGIGGGGIAVTESVLERNGCGIAIGSVPGGYNATIVDSDIVDNLGVGVSGNGSTRGTSIEIDRSTIARNGGGGLSAFGVNGAGPFVTVTDTTIAANTANRGGGILIAGDGGTRPTVTLVNSTVSGNTATDADGILNEAGDLDLRNVTLAGNGLVVDGDATAVARNSILAGGCHGTFASSGYNLIAPNTGCTITGDTTGNQIGSALLAALGNNGGPTATHALGPGSPARDAGNPAGCVDAAGDPLTSDQRGVARPSSQRCDIGAFEATCGNGTIDDGETCDDGNDDDGDCCSATCQSVPDGTSCSDANACSTGDICQSGACIAGPAEDCGPCLTCDPGAGCVAHVLPSCHQPTERFSGELEITAKPTRKVEWFWVEGEATTREEIGNPLGDDRYAFCLFDESQGGPRLAFRAATRPDPCGKKSCWKPTGKTGFQYSAPASDALRKMLLKSGRDGKAKVTVIAKGPELMLPALPVVLPIRAQLQAENGQCWEARFFPLGVSKNDAKLFRGKAFLQRP